MSTVRRLDVFLCGKDPVAYCYVDGVRSTELKHGPKFQYRKGTKALVWFLMKAKIWQLEKEAFGKNSEPFEGVHGLKDSIVKSLHHAILRSEGAAARIFGKQKTFLSFVRMGNQAFKNDAQEGTVTFYGGELPFELRFRRVLPGLPLDVSLDEAETIENIGILSSYAESFLDSEIKWNQNDGFTDDDGPILLPIFGQTRPRDTTIYCYVSIDELAKLVRHSELEFTRWDKLPSDASEFISESECRHFMDRRYGRTEHENFDTMWKFTQQTLRPNKHLAVSRWFGEPTDHSWAWKNDKHDVAISSTIDRLQEALTSAAIAKTRYDWPCKEANAVFDRVNYVNYDSHSLDERLKCYENHKDMAPLFFRDVHFMGEKEFRAVVYPLNENLNDWRYDQDAKEWQNPRFVRGIQEIEETTMSRDVNADILIKQVIVSPALNEWHYRAACDLIYGANIRAPVIRNSRVASRKSM